VSTSLEHHQGKSALATVVAPLIAVAYKSSRFRPDAKGTERSSAQRACMPAGRRRSPHESPRSLDRVGKGQGARAFYGDPKAAGPQQGGRVKRHREHAPRRGRACRERVSANAGNVRRSTSFSVDGLITATDFAANSAAITGRLPRGTWNGAGDRSCSRNGAGDGDRTHDIQLGKLSQRSRCA
jgi:hypothetical protein